VRLCQYVRNRPIRFVCYKEIKVVDFRRWILALAVLALFAGLARGQTQTAMPSGTFAQTAPTAAALPIARVMTAPGYKVMNIVTTKFGNPNNPEYFVVIRFASASQSVPTNRNTGDLYPSVENQSGSPDPATRPQTAGLNSCTTTLQYTRAFASVGDNDMRSPGRNPAPGFLADDNGR
jgi:hypothetical protein